MSSAIRLDEAGSFAFGPFILQPERQLLLRGETPVPLGGRALDLLTALVERAGELVEKRYLMERAWPDTHVEEGNLKVNIAALRRALRDTPEEGRYIATVTGRGYRFTAPVRRLPGPAPVLPVPARPRKASALPDAVRIVGRTQQIATARLAMDQGRLLSIVGPGGAGKSALARALAECLIVETGIDARWIDLSGLCDLDPGDASAGVHAAIAAALDRDGEGICLPEICDDLRAHDTLLILDSCEPVADAVADTVDILVAAVPGLRIVTTSREPLCARGERILRLGGLELPPPYADLPAEEAMRFAAVELFVERAGDVSLPFRLSDAEAPEVAQLCRMLDGLPLAIEFAAMQLGTFGTSQLRISLEERLDHLGGFRNGEPRQRSLRACIDWSYRLLSERERFLLRRLCRHMDSFTLASACRTGMEAGMIESAVIDDLAGLVSKSMVEAKTGPAVTRYRVPHTVRAYGLARLEESGKPDEVWPSHAATAFPGMAAADARRNRCGAGRPSLQVASGLPKDRRPPLRAS